MSYTPEPVCMCMQLLAEPCTAGCNPSRAVELLQDTAWHLSSMSTVPNIPGEHVTIAVQFRK